MALGNSTFYDLVIPKLYETVTITDTNKHAIHYGMYASQHNLLFLDKDAQDPYEVMSAPNGNTTRKDQAIDFCVRLIIDLPTNEIELSIEYIVDRLPHQPSGNVEELVFTSKALRRGPKNYGVWKTNLPQIIPHNKPINHADDIKYRNLKTKRVVLHLPIERGIEWAVVRPLSKWCKRRSQHRRPTSFVMHNLDRLESDYIFEYMNVDCHFIRCEWDHIGRFLAEFLSDSFSSRRTKSYPRLKLFDSDVYAAQDPERPPRDVQWLACSSLELAKTIWNGKGDKAASIRSIMDRISFCQTEFGVEEYPTLRPKPVTFLS